MKTKRIDVYVGLGNQLEHKEETREIFEKKLVEFFKEYKIDFSIVELLGGYVSENGNYIVEDALLISLVGDTKKEDLDTFVNYIKKEYNQESIMIECVDLDVKYM